MKNKFLLGCYNEIIREIRRQHLVSEATLIERIQAITNESFLIYRVDILSNNSEDYKLYHPIHNLWPDAPAVLFSDKICDKHMNFIAHVLNVRPEQLKPIQLKKRRRNF